MSVALESRFLLKMHRHVIIVGIAISLILVANTLASNIPRLRRFTADDLVQTRTIPQLAVSPDNEKYALVQKWYNLKLHRKEEAVSVYSLPRTQTDDRNHDDVIVSTVVNATLTNQQLLSKVSDLVWLSSDILGFTAQSGEERNIYFVDLRATSPTITKLSQFPLPVSNLQFNAETSVLAFTAEVYEDGDLWETYRKIQFEKERRSTGLVYDSLFVRHWDTWWNKRRSQLFVVDVNFRQGIPFIVGEPRNLLMGTSHETPVPPFGGLDGYAFSNNGSEIAFTSRVFAHNMSWQTNTNIYTVSLKPASDSGILNMTPDNEGYDSSPIYSSDGRFLAWLRMTTPGFEADRNRVMLLDRVTGKRRELTKGWVHSVKSILFSSDSKWIYAVVPDGANSNHQFVLLSTSESEPKPTVLRLPVSSHLTVLPSSDSQSDRVLFVASHAHYPYEVYLAIRTEKDFQTFQLTDLQSKHLTGVQLHTQDTFEFIGAKGDKVYGRIIVPFKDQPKEKVPLCFLIHGGPQGSWENDWGMRWNYQAFAGVGCVVVAIDPHGSTGYGQPFTDDVSKHWGGYPYIDLMKGLDYVLEKYPFIDQDRMCAFGASYGGYMVNWINGHTNRFACLVTHDGMFNTISAYYSTDELFFNEFEFGGVPSDSKARQLYEKWNPEKFVTKWKTPTLVIHGEKDYRLPVTEGLSVFTALQRQGIESRLLYFPDENHWVLQPENSLQWYKEVLRWFRKYTAEHKVKKRDQHWDLPEGKEFLHVQSSNQKTFVSSE